MSRGRLLGGVVLALQAALANAQAAPAASAGAAPSASPPALGRLFYTPEQRAAMDRERLALLARGVKPSAKPVVRKPAEAAEPPPLSTTYTLRGILRRSDGEATVWINDEAVSEKMAERGIARGSLKDESASLRLDESGRQVRLRVGQSVNSTGGRVVEPYQPRPAPSASPAPAPPPEARN